MGGDGGSIPKRDDLVKPKKKPESANKDDANAALWKHCALTQDPLREPVVACLLGRLYNKESVINKLLSKDKTPAVAEHIRKLRDVRELKLASHPTKSDAVISGQEPQTFFCPITKLDMSGTHQFVYLLNCGCVFSKKAVIEVGDYRCMMCGTAYKDNEVILINPQSEEDIKTANERLIMSQQSAYKAQKSKRQAKESTITKIPGSDGDCNAVTGSKVDADEDIRIKKPKLLNDESKQPVSDSDVISNENSNTAKSIQENPNVSNVYKSLFTSSKEAKCQPKAHWVTFNPLYFR